MDVAGSAPDANSCTFAASGRKASFKAAEVKGGQGITAFQTLKSNLTKHCAKPGLEVGEWGKAEQKGQ